MTDHVVVAQEEGVLILTFNRPDKKNAITDAMYGVLADSLENAERDPAVRAVLFQGEGDAFTAGNDLMDFAAQNAGGDTDRSMGERNVTRFLKALARAQTPLVAAVDGLAVGVGVTMLLHCDFVYAAPNAKFNMPFVALGLVPEAASSLLLPMIAGYQRAAELLMLARPFDAAKAHAAGIVTEIVPEAELFERARETALALAALPAASVRLTKQLMKHQLGEAIAAQMKEEGRIFAERLGSPEAKEAMTAFFEKRKPDFSRFG